MAVYSPENSPSDNLSILAENEYVGLMFVQGFVGETAVQACTITGRSEGSRNRIYVVQDNIVSTEVFDKTKPVDRPDLTIYDTMRRFDRTHIVSNGDQTGTAIQFLRSGLTFAEAMRSRTYEPDENFTPRISGFLNTGIALGRPRMGISLITKAPDSEDPVHAFWTEESDEIEVRNGIGYAVQTYQHDVPKGETLPSFEEAPFALPLENTARHMAEFLWENLHPQNRVAVAAKTVSPSGTMDFHVINLHPDPMAPRAQAA